MACQLASEKGVYVDASESAETILERHKEFNNSFGFEHTNAFPYLYGILKAHKNPPKIRWIAGVCNKSKLYESQSSHNNKDRDKVRRQSQLHPLPQHQRWWIYC